VSTTPTFERFIEAVRGTNPFRSHRITDPEGHEATVENIHQGAFDKLKRMVEEAKAEGAASTGALLLGAAGVGKSHLLARLFQWAREDHATVVYLHNILASPERMLRYVLNATVNDLAGQRGSGLEQAKLYAVLTRALVAGGFHRKSLHDIDARQEALMKLAPTVDPRRTVLPVLNAYFTGISAGSRGDAEAEERAQAAVLWLAGETLGPEEARRLNLPADDEGAALADDAAVERVLHVIAHLCAIAKRPLVLCLDQVDNLDAEPARALMAYAHALIDRAKNLVIIVSGVKDSLLAMHARQVIPAAAWDRIAEHKLELHMVKPTEARAILERRLDAALEMFDEDVKEVVAARKRDRLFPLGGAWLAERLDGAIDVRPRDAILWARDRWEGQQDRIAKVGGQRWLTEWPGPESRGPEPPQPKLEDVIDAEVQKKLVEGTMQRRLQPALLPPDEDNLATLTHYLLAQCAGCGKTTLVSVERPAPAKRGAATTYHLLAKERRADGAIVTTGVTFVCAPSGHGARAPLQRMLEDKKAPDHRVLVTDEERRPLRLGGVGKTAHDGLKKLGDPRFLHVKLDLERHAELDALVGVLWAAKSEDLEIEHPRGRYRKVTEAEVMESFHRQKSLLAHPLLRELLTEETPTAAPDSATEADWDETRTREHILAELSWRLGMMAKELAQIFAKRQQLPERRFLAAWAHTKRVAQALHDAGLVHATAQDDDIFVQHRSKR
jgi:AAA ATPase domain